MKAARVAGAGAAGAAVVPRTATASRRGFFAFRPADAPTPEQQAAARVTLAENETHLAQHQAVLPNLQKMLADLSGDCDKKESALEAEFKSTQPSGVDALLEEFKVLLDQHTEIAIETKTIELKIAKLISSNARLSSCLHP